MGRRGQHGVTLVEIAIVLVIIGLLVGGVLKGQQVLANARLAMLEDDYRRLAGAVLAYRERYGVLPGDDPRASARFPGSWQPGDDGNGDGILDGAWNAADGHPESRTLWKHLRAAGLLAGPVDLTAASYAPPAHAFGGPVGMAQGPYNLPGPALVFGRVPTAAAAALETRGDDGNPARGAIRGPGTASAGVNGTVDLAFGF